MLQHGIMTHAQLEAIERLADLVEQQKMTRTDAMQAVMQVSAMKVQLDELAKAKAKAFAKHRRSKGKGKGNGCVDL